MNQQDKKQYIDELQKNIVRTCFIKCSNPPKQLNKCYQTCYEKYMKVINTTNNTIKQVGYQKNSLIAYKGYPQHNIQSLFSLTSTIVDTLNYFPFAIQHQQSA